MTPPDRDADFHAMSESSVVLGGGWPPPLEEARSQGSIARHGVNSETLVLDVPMLRMTDEDPPFDQDLFLAPWAVQKSREEGGEDGAEEAQKTEEEEAPESCLRSWTSL